MPCPTGGCRWQARLGSLLKFLFQGLYRNGGGDRLEGSVWHIYVLLCCLFVCECQKSAALSMELSAYGLLAEQCLCVSMGAEHSCWSRGYRQAMAGSPTSPWPLSQVNRLWVCSSPTGAAKQELAMYTLSINSSLLLWPWDVWMWFHKGQVYVQKILFHHFWELPRQLFGLGPWASLLLVRCRKPSTGKNISMGYNSYQQEGDDV